ncbi:cation channel sperm-associated protein 4-like isoform X2 [Halichondria panicea]|uniref:cation channel sperm-associated protein 4-like isoform X2 n=1 Tax=Halichondria panicea TaxID=6063 RepID=UPI00312B7E61
MTWDEYEADVSHVKSKLLFLHNSKAENKSVNFHDVVDEDDRSMENRFSLVYIGWLIDSALFRVAMLIAIFLNCVVIGVQTDRYLEENFSAVFIALDKFFLTVFTLEILIKWYHDFIGFWKVAWNLFDFVIVSFSLIGPRLTFLSGTRLLTILRVLRALRSLRSISALRGLRVVVQTVIYSLPDMANIVALLLIFMFLFAILGQSFFGDNCKRNFGSLGTTMFSLFVCVTQDGWVNIFRELNACGNAVLGAIYLLIFITIGAFVFANLVVAVVVTNLEWSIAEQRKLEAKPPVTPPSKIETVDPEDCKLTREQESLQLPQMNGLKLEKLENYFLVLSAQEDNLSEFTRLQQQIIEIHQEVKALTILADDASDDELSGMASHASSSSPPPTHTRRRRFNSLMPGDAISDLILMNRANPVASSHNRSLRQMISTLATAEARRNTHSQPHNAHSLSSSIIQANAHSSDRSLRPESN